MIIVSYKLDKVATISVAICTMFRFILYHGRRVNGRVVMDVDTVKVDME